MDQEITSLSSNTGDAKLQPIAASAKRWFLLSSPAALIEEHTY